MLEYLLDQTDQRPSPPTKELIEKVRLQQLAALQELRSKLLDVRKETETAA